MTSEGKKTRGKDISSFGYNLNRSIKNWSCEYKDLIIEYKNNNLSYVNYSLTKLKFLKKIISLEKLKKGDEIEVVKYWQQINNKFEKGEFPYFITNMDDNWQENLDSFWINVIGKKDLNKNHALNIDTCEKNAFLNIYKEIEEQNSNSYFMSIDLIIDRNRELTQGNDSFSRYFKKLTIGYDEKDNITVEIKRYLNYR